MKWTPRAREHRDRLAAEGRLLRGRALYEAATQTIARMDELLRGATSPQERR